MIPQRGGFPHSDIHGSTPARGSPWLFAACHVLHRLLVPRHPPNALLSLKNCPALFRRRNPIMHRSHPHLSRSASKPRPRQAVLSLSHATPTGHHNRRNAADASECRVRSRNIETTLPPIARHQTCSRIPNAGQNRDPASPVTGETGATHPGTGQATSDAPRDAPEPDSH